MKNILVITMALTVAVYAFGATKRIARVNEDGDIIFDRDAGFSPDVIEVEVSEVDGSIYVSMDRFNIGKFYENGFWDDSFDLPLFVDTYGFDIDSENYLWITGPESSDWGLYKYTSSGDYVDGLEDFAPTTAKHNGLSHIWSGDRNAGSSMIGVHKISDDLDRDLYLDQYKPFDTSYDKVSKHFWFMNGKGGIGSVVKLNEDGDEEFEVFGIEAPDDLQASPIDGGCWLIQGSNGDLIKLNSLGAVIFHDGSFNEIAAIDVNESDGSVWVASNIPKRLVHLDKDGNRQLYKQWPGGDFAHLAADQRNGTCIVIYEESKSGDLNIQPASVGEIKAMYAD
jgi:hypothetical protein